MLPVGTRTLKPSTARTVPNDLLTFSMTSASMFIHFPLVRNPSPGHRAADTLLLHYTDGSSLFILAACVMAVNGSFRPGQFANRPPGDGCNWST